MKLLLARFATYFLQSLNLPPSIEQGRFSVMSGRAGRQYAITAYTLAHPVRGGHEYELYVARNELLYDGELVEIQRNSGATLDEQLRYAENEACRALGLDNAHLVDTMVTLQLLGHC